MPSKRAATATEYAHISRDPGILGGEARIDGHRIRVRDVVAARDLGGYSPEEIASTIYPDLTLAQVYAALAYYEDHRDEIDRAAASEADTVRKITEQQPSIAIDRRSDLNRR